MKPIRLPEPPSSPTVSGGGLPDIFEGSVHGVIRRAVVIGNGFPSSENQSLGLVRALGLSDRQTFYRVTRPTGGVNEWLHWLPVSVHKMLYYIITTLYRCSQQFIFPGKSKRLLSVRAENGGSTGLSSILEADVKNIVSMARDEFENDGPLLVIASGRDTISTASAIKRLTSEKVFVIQIQHPRTHLDRFDLVITPQHDYYPLTPQAQQQIPRLFRRWITPRDPPDTHVVLTLGSLHQIDSTSLRNAAITWHEEFSSIPKPLLVVNIGGPTGQCRYGLDLAKQLVASLHNVLASCGSVRISFTKRTPNKISRFIEKDLGNHPKVYIWDGQGPNPHMGHLAWADSFIITADSVSMLSEACSTGKPVYVIGSERCKWKFMEFHKSLRDRGLVRPFTGLEDMSESWSYPPLNDTADAAQKVHEELAKRGWKIRA